LCERSETKRPLAEQWFVLEDNSKIDFKEVKQEGISVYKT
jgi:hypothetical protein